MSQMVTETYERDGEPAGRVSGDFDDELLLFDDGDGEYGTFRSVEASSQDVLETVREDQPYLGSYSPSIDMEERHNSTSLEEKDASSSDSPSSDSEDDMDPRAIALASIQDLLLSFLRQLADCIEGLRGTVTLQLADRRKPRGENGDFQTRTLAFPRSTRNGTSMQGLAALIAVLTYIYEALITGVPTTKRDIYYRDVALFKRQSVVDNLVDDIAATFQLDRDDLLVRAASKGLFCGSILSLRLANGALVAGNDNQPAIIPAGNDIEGMVVEEDIGWILVVEKEAIFQTLCQVGFARENTLGKPGVIFTGKGYPDIATRQLVHKLSTGLPHSIPIFALVDADPYGVDILACYAFGSESLHHQREGLVAERIQWLGVQFSEMEALGIPQEGLLRLTERDERKIRTILARDEEVMPQAWKDELQCMLDTGLKAEIEVVCSLDGPPNKLPLVRYLEDKMRDYYDR